MTTLHSVSSYYQENRSGTGYSNSLKAVRWINYGSHLDSPVTWVYYLKNHVIQERWLVLGTFQTKYRSQSINVLPQRKVSSRWDWPRLASLPEMSVGKTMNYGVQQSEKLGETWPRFGSLLIGSNITASERSWTMDRDLLSCSGCDIYELATT